MIEWILSSSILIAAVALLRRIFKGKIRARIQYALWALVLLRLLTPVSIIQGPVSMGNLMVYLQGQPAIQSAVSALNTPAVSYDEAYELAQAELEQSDGRLPQSYISERRQTIMDLSTPAYIIKLVAYAIWFVGMAVVAVFFLISNIRFSKHLKTHRQPLERTGAICDVYTCEDMDTPCLFGLIRPAIYMTPEAADDEIRRSHILAHETTHLRHFDQLWSALRCVCLVLHWYNPLVWLAASLSRRDAELACDEATIRRIGEDQRVPYGTTLIEMTCEKRSAAGLLHIATTMTGSKAAIKERITRIARKTENLLYALIAVVLVAAIFAGFTLSGLGIPTLSAQKQQELQASFSDIFRGSDPSGKWCSDNNPNGVRYYGTFEGCDFLFEYDNNSPAADGKYYTGIGDEIFLSNGIFRIHVHGDLDRSGDLNALYQTGYISKETVQKLVQVHNAYERKLGRDWYSYYPDLDKITRANITPSPQKKQEISLASGGWYYTYYGSFEGYDILFSESPLTVLGVIEIAGEYFRSGNLASLCAYRDGVFYDLEKLYEDGLISKEAIRQIVQVHIVYTQKLRWQR